MAEQLCEPGGRYFFVNVGLLGALTSRLSRRDNDADPNDHEPHHVASSDKKCQYITPKEPISSIACDEDSRDVCREKPNQGTKFRESFVKFRGQVSWTKFRGQKFRGQKFRGQDKSFVDKSFVDRQKFRGQKVSWTDGSFVDRRDWKFREVSWTKFRGQTGLTLSTKSPTPLLIISGLRTRAVSKASRANRPI